jgi:hypothetical protein
MPYSDFDLKTVKKNSEFICSNKRGSFPLLKALRSARHFKIFCTVSLARAINTEKARSELIISNMLFELLNILNNTRGGK